jgi:hypothetical protein
MEQYLRSYVSYLQKDWEQWLALAEFSANNHASETTGMSLFFANLGYDSLWQFNLSQPSQATPTQDRPATDVARTMIEITNHLKTEMHRAQLRQQEQADRRRAFASNFKIGDKVWFNSKNIVTRRSSRKLDHRRMRPFEIVKIVSP